jgi:Holliday junction resolvase RusA-like endonuclease
LIELIVPDQAPTHNNAYFNNFGHGRTMKSDVRHWKERVVAQVERYVEENGIDPTKLKKIPMQLEIKFYLVAMYRSDLDGRIKIIQDALFKGLGLNDAYVVDLHVTKHLDKEYPRSEISMRPM